ncbi:ABC transporter ATP-binding protein [Marivibrio halodurans]|uniref:ABC transporter ATP-binding protein n=1 Tax=Marivibrio halodurans TaxID=2039722 RepID=A0A8J7V4B2_9PROT|nr:ABC transporter ATP-binding protein [Marivibrio halodurans]MBP5858897.1 ABC transporter ATP-binding protein [Marivibrio halodurans]
MASKSKISDDDTRVLVARLWRDYMRFYLGRLTVAVICMAIVGGASGGIVYLVEQTLDEALIAGSETMIWTVAIGFLIVAFTRGAANFAQTTLMHSVGLRIIQRMQGQMFNALQRADIQYLHDEGTARQLSRFSNDVNFLRDAISKVFTSAGRDSLVVLVLVGQMFYLNWQMAVVAFVFFPVSVLPIVRIGRRLRRVSATTQSEFGQMTSVLDDSLKGARQVRAYRMQDYEQRRADNAFAEMYRLVFKAAVVRSLTYPIMDGLSGAALAAILVWGGYQILQDTMTVGEFMAFFMAVITAYQPMRSIANLNAALQEGLAAAQRIFSIIDYEPRIQDKPDARTLVPESGRVALRDVHFSYSSGEPVLHGVDLEVPAGETVALVGPSGAGKSTVLNLIPRFYDVAAGAVEVDGQDVRDVTMDSLLAQIGLVSQETTLFNDTVRANIAYGRTGASEAEIVEAAKSAAAHDFIMGLPQGYETVVGEQGVKLSGGQRQRIAIARAMLKNAPILLLDEATSALDTESERQVQGALKRLMAGRTVVVIAHRLSTIADADRIYVMQGGRVVESGTHSSLSAHGGLYARLQAMQFQGIEEVPASDPEPDRPSDDIEGSDGDLDRREQAAGPSGR